MITDEPFEDGCVGYEHGETVKLCFPTQQLQKSVLNETVH
jgi:hypothetical protein